VWDDFNHSCIQKPLSIVKRKDKMKICASMITLILCGFFLSACGPETETPELMDDGNNPLMITGGPINSDAFMYRNPTAELGHGKSR
jgi:hypothetical protein